MFMHSALLCMGVRLSIRDLTKIQWKKNNPGGLIDRVSNTINSHKMDYELICHCMKQKIKLPS